MQALRRSSVCSERDRVLRDIIEFYGLVGSPALGETARDVAKDLPIRLLHGGGHAAWLDGGARAVGWRDTLSPGPGNPAA